MRGIWGRGFRRTGLRRKIYNKRKKMFIVFTVLLFVYIMTNIIMTNGAGEKSKAVKEKNTIKNAWLISTTDNSVKVFCDGEEKTFLMKNKLDESYENVICDLNLENNLVNRISIKPKKVKGRLEAISDKIVKIEGYGSVELTEDSKVFKMYDDLEEMKNSDVTIGNKSVEYVLQEDKVCAVLVEESAKKTEYINVIIKTDNFSSIFHDGVTLSSKDDLIVKYLKGDSVEKKDYEEEEIEAGEQLEINNGSNFDEYTKDTIVISAKTKENGIRLNSIKRESDNITYKGEIRITKYEEGYVIVNKLNIEDYLCAVVPSEMPSSYGMEALKAQAVCARTYAYMQKEGKKYKEYGANVDDSTSFQVYNNQTTEEKTSKAVEETKGKVLTYDGELTTTYFYSTSCGYTSSATEVFSGKFEDKTIDKYIIGKMQSIEETDLDLTKENEFKKFIDGNINCFEKDCSWYRWSVNISKENMTKQVNENLEKVNSDYIRVLIDDEFKKQDIDSIGEVKSIKVGERLTGGLATELIIEGEEATIKILTQQCIRTILGPLYDEIQKANNKSVKLTLLPSAYFYIISNEDSYNIVGGGFGHGAGLSQDGAGCLADLDKDYEDILQFYFENTEITQY